MWKLQPLPVPVDEHVWFGQYILILSLLFTNNHQLHSGSFVSILYVTNCFSHIQRVFLLSFRCSNFPNISANWKIEGDMCSMKRVVDNATEIKCTEWFYEKEYGYESISTEVSCFLFHFLSLPVHLEDFIGWFLFYFEWIWNGFYFIEDGYRFMGVMLLTFL